MKLNELQYTEGARHSKKRLGRGTSSGLGKTSGKGHKGQNARTGVAFVLVLKGTNANLSPLTKSYLLIFQQNLCVIKLK